VELQVARKGLEEGGLAGTGYPAEVQVGVENRMAHQITAVVLRAGAGGDGVWWGSKNGGVLKEKSGSGKRSIWLGMRVRIEGGGNKVTWERY
jgi:hypothetical protein